jgi:ribosomal protein S18 acetylase RimI-like enzyme
MMLRHRALERSDADIIAGFPQSEEELFYFFPNAQYPLQPEILLMEAEHRSSPTVVVSDDGLGGYGNFTKAEPGEFCSIGNVVVNPAMRRMGIGSYLVETLSEIAFNKLKAKYVKISCFNKNTKGLLLYHKLGFTPHDMEVRQTFTGQNVALIHMCKYAN